MSRLVGWIGLAAGIVSIAMHYVETSNLLLVVLTSLVPFGIIVAVFGSGGFAVARSWRLFALSLLIAVGAAATQIPLYTQTDAEPGVRLTVMQANILFNGTDARTIVDLVREHRVDILTVNELTPEAVDGLVEAGIGALLPYRFVRPEDFADGTGIYSRYPLTNEVAHSEFTMNNLSATAQVPELGDLPVFALHPVPPVIAPNDWDAEMGISRELLAETKGPAIVGADFNATYDHAQFRALLGRFEDATEQAGAGHLLTYPTDKWGFPIVGVDHILVAGGTATSARAIELPGSDHRALLATVVLKGR